MSQGNTRNPPRRWEHAGNASDSNKQQMHRWIIDQAVEACQQTDSQILGAAVVIASALRSVASSVRAVAGGNGPDNPTGLELVSNALNRLTDAINNYVLLPEDPLDGSHKN